MIERALFLAAAGLAVAGALGAALVKNLFQAALLLGLCLLGTAGLYLFLQQHYLACLQIVVYVGGVLVLILFATLFSADVMGRVQRASFAQKATGAVGAIAAAAVAVATARDVVAHGRGLLAVRDATAAPDAIAAPQGAIGDLLVGPWLPPFLLAGFLLTIALVASVATVRRFRRPEAAHG